MKVETSLLFSPRRIIALIKPFARCDSRVHGVAHWARVFRFGMLLADALDLSDIERLAVALFAWTHDLARTDDQHGRNHAKEGAEYLAHVVSQCFCDFPQDVLDITAMAIRYHSHGDNAEEILHQYPVDKAAPWPRESLLNVWGCCWDADRLDLLRLNIFPDDNKMSTLYWKDILPLAAKLNQKKDMLEATSPDDRHDENSWFL